MNTPENPNYFASNLNLIREFHGWSMSRFAKEVCVPKSTLQTVLATGQSSLDTALRIARHLGIPLDILTNIPLSSQNIEVAYSVFHTFGWYSQLTNEGQREAATCFQSIFRLIQEAQYEVYI